MGKDEPPGGWTLSHTAKGARVCVRRPVMEGGLILVYGAPLLTLLCLYGLYSMLDCDWVGRFVCLVISSLLGLVAFAFWYALAFYSGYFRETVWRDGDALCLRRHLPGAFSWVGLTSRYPLGRLGPLLVARPREAGRKASPEAPVEGGRLAVGGTEAPLRPSSAEALSGALWSGGRRYAGVGFRYRGDTVRIGRGLDQGQAAKLADVLAERFGLRKDRPA